MSFDGDPLAYYGKCILDEHHARLLSVLPPFRDDPNVPNPFDISDDELRFLPKLKVGILGAGVGGLYTALMLDSLGIEYDIIEASDRFGGRLQTYKFLRGGQYDYYETGAMRFPLPKKDSSGQYKNGVMKRLAELTEYAPLNQGSDRLKDKLIPFYYGTREGSRPSFYYFNGILQDIVPNQPKGPFGAEAMKVDAEYIRAGADAISDDVTNPFIRILIDDVQSNKKTGWNVLKANDLYSVRGYMASKYMPSDGLKLLPQHLSSNVINWLELLGQSSGGFDRALTDSVFELLAFAHVGGTDYGDVDWKCFEGGSETLTKKMEEYIRGKGVSIQFRQRVTAIGQGFMIICLPTNFPKDKIPLSIHETVPDSVDVVIDDRSRGKCIRVPCVTVRVNGTETKRYSHVISTLPLPVLRTVDLNGAGLNLLQKNALRALDYGPSVKIAILFKSNWWTTRLGIVGGQSFTDLPIRTIVYPSYGLNPSAPCKVLIASYTWTTDAFRLSALSSETERELLKELVLRNLAELHGTRDRGITYEYLVEQYVDMHVKDWNGDKYTMGAFALFSPGEFDDLYTSLNTPAANNRLHFAGEAISTRHGWVVGALDSAWKAVYEYLKVTGQNDKIETFLRIWGRNVEWTTRSTMVNPDLYDSEGVTMPDMLDEHLGLVNKAVQSGFIQF